jgi:hypothetical protein
MRTWPIGGRNARAYAGGEHVDRHRFDHVVVSADVESGDDAIVPVVAGHDDDRRAAPHVEPLAQLAAVDVAEPEIEQDGIMVRGVVRSAGGAPVGDCGHCEPRAVRPSSTARRCAASSSTSRMDGTAANRSGGVRAAGIATAHTSFTHRKPGVPTVDNVREEHTPGAVDIGLGPRERAVLSALVDNGGRVVDRDQLRRDAGLESLSARRCDAVLVGIRRALGPHSVVTVRRRGWRLHPDAMAVALAIISTLG